MAQTETYVVSKQVVDAWFQSALAKDEQESSNDDALYNKVLELHKVFRNNNNSGAAASSPRTATPHAGCDVSTQVTTIRAVSYTRNVLTRVQAERAARGLAHMVGRLGAAVQQLAEDLLQTLGLLHANTTKWTTALLAQKAELAALSETIHASAAPMLSLEEDDERKQRVQDSLAVLRPTTVAAVRAVIPSFRGDKGAATEVASEQRRQVEQLLTLLAAAKPPEEKEVKQRVMAPFICRQCRQDQRKAFTFDDKGTLSSAAAPTRPKATAAAAGAATTRVPTPPPKATTSKTLPPNTGANFLVVSSEKKASRELPPIKKRKKSK